MEILTTVEREPLIVIAVKSYRAPQREGDEWYACGPLGYVFGASFHDCQNNLLGSITLFNNNCPTCGAHTMESHCPACGVDRNYYAAYAG